MEYPKDRCAFCEHTTRNAPVVTKEYLESLKATDDHLDLVLDVDQVLSENYDVFIPILKYGSHTLLFGTRKGNYCGISDSLGEDLLGMDFLVITPPFMTEKHIFVLQNKDHEWGVLNLDDPYNPQIIVPFGTYKYIWGFDSNHSLISAKGIGKSGTFEGRGIINTSGEIVVGFREYKDIWNFYNNRSGLIKVETFDGRTLHLLKRNPLHKAVNGFVYPAKSHYAEEPIYGSSYNKYGGSYAQDVAGLSDDVIDDAFEGDPEAYWNID